MAEKWQAVEGTGWIEIPGFGRVAPRQDNEAGGRQYFTPKTSSDQYAKVTGESITGGPETWHFEFDQPFLMADWDGNCLEVEIGSLVGGRYAVRYRPGLWPEGSSGGW